MKKLVIAAVVACALAVLSTGCFENEPKEYPSSDVFTLEVSCEKNVPVGKNAKISYTLRNTGGNNYDITIHKSFFHVFIDGKPVQVVGGNSITETQFTRGESDGQTISYVPDKAGTHEIKVVAAFDVRRSPSESKPYSYQKTLSINATK